MTDLMARFISESNYVIPCLTTMSYVRKEWRRQSFAYSYPQNQIELSSASPSGRLLSGTRGIKGPSETHSWAARSVGMNFFPCWGSIPTR